SIVNEAGGGIDKGGHGADLRLLPEEEMMHPPGVLGICCVNDENPSPVGLDETRRMLSGVRYRGTRADHIRPIARINAGEQLAEWTVGGRGPMPPQLTCQDQPLEQHARVSAVKTAQKVDLVADHQIEVLDKPSHCLRMRKAIGDSV